MPGGNRTADRRGRPAAGAGASGRREKFGCTLYMRARLVVGGVVDAGDTAQQQPVGDQAVDGGVDRGDVAGARAVELLVALPRVGRRLPCGQQREGELRGREAVLRAGDEVGRRRL